jgi:hypothetical protein
VNIKRRGGTCEFREVVGLEQALGGLLPAALVHEVVPLRDLVAQWAACVGLVAEGHSTVHASRRLQPPTRWYSIPLSTISNK